MRAFLKFTVVLWLVSWTSRGAPAGTTEGAVSEAVIDEVIAGVEANEALIAHGAATYTVRSTTHANGATLVAEGELKEWFDYPNIQFEWRGAGRVDGETVTERTLLAGAYRYQFLVPWGWGVAGPPGAACVAFIDSRNRGRTGFLHPREQFNIYYASPPSFADRLREMRRVLSGASPTAVRESNGLIHITYDPPEGDGGMHHGRYWVSPEHGYCLVRVEEWPRWSPTGKPAWRYEATARPAGNGAYVLGHRIQTSLQRSASSELVPRKENEATLREIDLSSRPDPSLFTIDGLALPPGTRIRDNVHGREFLYEANAVDEKSIVVPPAGAPMAARRWLWVGSLAAGMGAICWLIYGSRRSTGAIHDSPPAANA